MGGEPSPRSLRSHPSPASGRGVDDVPPAGLPSPASGGGAGGEGARSTNRHLAKVLRSNMTDAERKLWYHLRANRFAGLHFKRQVPIGPYIVDFACVSEKLIVEVDGSQHLESQRDAERDAWLGGAGFRVLRFWNDEVLKQTELVLEAVLRAARPSPPAPPPCTGEGS